MIPGSSGSSYVSQSSTGRASPHSSAYSALSASLATLKSRLNARGVTLSSPLSDGGSQSSLYQSTGLSEGHQPAGAQPQSQPTYLSVTNQQDQQSSTVNGYSTGSQNHQNNENKTIVLAIPAKINFLTDGRSSSSKQQQQQPQLNQQQQAQQLTVIQPASDQQVRNEYSAKQSGKCDSIRLRLLNYPPLNSLFLYLTTSLVNKNADIIGTQEGLVDPSGQNNAEHEHQQQYVIVNSPATSSDQSALVSSNLATGGLTQTSGPLYTNIYPAIQPNAYAMKYIPNYPQSIIQPPTIPKIYSTGSEQAAAHDVEQLGRYSGCLETCNSLDSRWKKYSTSKYRACCSRSAQYDPQYDQTNSDKVTDKYADDAYYNYLYRKSRGRRSRRTYRGSGRYHRYSPSSASHLDDEGAQSGDLGGESGRSNSGRSTYSHYEVSPYMKYYKSRQQSSAHDTTDSSRDGPDVAVGGKYPNRAHRRGRSRDFDGSSDAQSSHDSNDDEGSESPRSPTGYGSGEYSVDADRFTEPRSSRLNEEDENRNLGFEEAVDQDSARNGQSSEGSEHPVEQAPVDTSTEDSEPETAANYKYPSSRRRKFGKGRSRKLSSGKDSKFYKKSRKGRFNKQEQASSQSVNGTESSAHSEQYHSQEQTPASDQEEQSYQKDTPTNEGNEAEKEVLSLANKYRASLNESAVANLSKTTMQLKEILSILEKKAHLKANESTIAPPIQQITSTPSPVTTTGIYSSSIYNLPSYGSSSLQSALSSDYLGSSDLSLKSPYRYEPSSLSSVGSSGLSMPSSYNSFSSDAYGSIPGYSASHYNLATHKHLPLPNTNLPRKRRNHKNVRYNNMMIPKAQNLHASSSSIVPSSSKSNFLNPYYSLQYPYWYSRGASAQVTNSYPYRNLMKNPYSTILNNSAKIAAAASGSHYSDESRIHPLTYDPLSNVASSLRPSSMRLRSKPFVFQPHVLPIYTRHTILTQPIDVKRK